MTRGILKVGIAMVLLAGPGRAQAQRTDPWPDSYVSRLQALALVQTLNAELLASRSATLTLERWCGEHRLAASPRIVVERVDGPAPPLDAEQRARLQVGDSTPVRYRHVRLRCGERVLSEAENWYVPERLTAGMNRMLDSTDTPFGRVVLPLAPYRRTFAAALLWKPLPDGWERGADDRGACTVTGMLEIPAALFEHRAVLIASDQRPIAEVREVYQHALLGPAPAGPCESGG